MATVSALPLIATMVAEMLDAAGQNHNSLVEARTRPAMLDDATLDGVERVWGDTQADHWLFVDQVARWKREALTPAQREVVEHLENQVTALGELLLAILDLPRSSDAERSIASWRRATSNSAWSTSCGAGAQRPDRRRGQGREHPRRVGAGAHDPVAGRG